MIMLDVTNLRHSKTTGPPPSPPPQYFDQIPVVLIPPTSKVPTVPISQHGCGYVGDSYRWVGHESYSEKRGFVYKVGT